MQHRTPFAPCAAYASLLLCACSATPSDHERDPSDMQPESTLAVEARHEARSDATHDDDAGDADPGDDATPHHEATRSPRVPALEAPLALCLRAQADAGALAQAGALRPGSELQHADATRQARARAKPPLLRDLCPTLAHFGGEVDVVEQDERAGSSARDHELELLAHEFGRVDGVDEGEIDALAGQAP